VLLPKKICSSIRNMCKTLCGGPAGGGHTPADQSPLDKPAPPRLFSSNKSSWGTLAGLCCDSTKGPDLNHTTTNVHLPSSVHSRELHNHVVAQ
jgi:hypothetical protein